MNKERRKQITALVTEIEDIRERLDILKEEEQEYHDNIPDNLQESEKAEKSSSSIDNLESAYDLLEEAIESLNESIE